MSANRKIAPKLFAPHLLLDAGQHLLRSLPHSHRRLADSCLTKKSVGTCDAERVDNVADKLSEGQEVEVRVVDIKGRKVGLSMRAPPVDAEALSAEANANLGEATSALELAFMKAGIKRESFRGADAAPVEKDAAPAPAPVAAAAAPADPAPEPVEEEAAVPPAPEPVAEPVAEKKEEAPPAPEAPAAGA